MMRRVTITDVARAAGLSISTISKVVNGRDGIAPATQEHVRRVIDELGYVGNIGAQSLRTRRTGVIGVLVSQFEPYSAEILKGVGQRAQGTNTEIMAWAGASDAPTVPDGWEKQLLGRLAGTIIDGAIIVTPGVAGKLGPYPVVAVDPQEIHPDQPCIHSDDEVGIRSAVEHLVTLGHRRIGFIGGRRDLASAAAREQGFRAAITEAGLSVDESHIHRGDYSAAGADGPAGMLLDDPERPTAIIAANDVSALRIIAAAQRRGLEVPADLSVVGFDDIPEAARSNPGLTTVAQPLQDIGAVALEMLLEMLDGNQPEVMHHTLDTQLIVRESTAPPAHVLDHLDPRRVNPEAPAEPESVSR